MKRTPKNIVELFDINLLFALVVPDHSSHLAAHRWNTERGSQAFATCAITESGLVRLLMNGGLQKYPLNMTSAIQLIKSIHAEPNHSFIEVMPSLSQESVFKELVKVRGFRQVSDAYLMAIARHNGAKLATMDKKLIDTFDEEYLVVVPSI